MFLPMIVLYLLRTINLFSDAVAMASTPFRQTKKPMT